MPREPLSPLVRRSLGALVLVLAATGCGAPSEAPSGAAATGAAPGAVERGGDLVVALAAEPRTFNPLFARDANSVAVLRRLHADLVHIDRATRDTVPALAESWERSDDGRRFVLTLREGLRFSDGTPATVEDVLFTFEVYLDEAVGSPSRELLVVGGEPIAVRALDDRRIEFQLAEPYAVGERLFDSLPILPRRALEEAYRNGELEAAWGPSAVPETIVGLGPFRLAEHVPGERIVLRRNPHYWRHSDAGEPLPHLDSITFLVVPDREARVVRFRAGETHLIDRLSPEDYDLLAAAGEAGPVLRDLGPDLTFTFLFFNLNDLTSGAPAETSQRWFRDPAFRRAVSIAIDRQAIVDLVYRGRATALGSHVSPGLGGWYASEVAPPATSPDASREILAAAGYGWDDRGRLVDATGAPVRFTIVTNSSNRHRVRILSVLQSDLDAVGIGTEVVQLDFGAVLERVLRTHDYEACVLGLGGGDADPNSVMNVLVSTGGSHLWRLSADGELAPWQREIDELMARQLVTLDHDERRRTYARVQALVAEHLPFVPLVSPHLLVAAQPEVGNFSPSILDHPTLWNADELYLRAATPAADP